MKRQLVSLGLIAVPALLICSCASPEAAPGKGRGGGEEAVFQWMDEGRWAEVENYANNELRGPNEIGQRMLLLGYAAQADGRTTESLEHFLKAGRHTHDWKNLEKMAEKSGTATGLLIAADTLARRGQYSEAIERLDAALSKRHDLPGATLLKATILAIQEKKDESLKCLQALLDRDTPSVDALCLIAMMELSTSTTETTLHILNYSVALEPDNALAYQCRGIALAHMGLWDSAASDFEHAFRLAPDMEEARVNWQLAQKAANTPGTTLVERQTGSITIVMGDDRKMQTDAAIVGAGILQKKGIDGPTVYKNPSDAVKSALSGNNVILRVDGGKYDLGEHLRNDILSKADSRITWNVVTIGERSAANIANALVRPGLNARIGGVTVVDPTEHGGLLGKTPFAISDTRRTAEILNTVAARGANIQVLLTEGKPGVQHVGNVNTYSQQPNLTVAVTESRTALTTSLSLGISNKGVGPGLGIGLADATHSAGGTRETASWRIIRGNKETVVRGNVFDIGGNSISIPSVSYGSPDCSAPSSPHGQSRAGMGSEGRRANLPRIIVSTSGNSQLDMCKPGGVRIGTMAIQNGSAGRITMEDSLSKTQGNLLLVMPMAIQIHSSTAKGN